MPGHPVEAFEEDVGVHAEAAALVGFAEQPGEDHLGARVGRLDRPVADLQQAGVAGRRDREGEVEEVGLVPDLPGVDRLPAVEPDAVLGEHAGAVFAPEVAARAVAFDHPADEAHPAAPHAAVVDRQPRALAPGPARHSGEERQHGQALVDGGGDFAVGARPVPRPARGSTGSSPSRSAGGCCRSAPPACIRRLLRRSPPAGRCRRSCAAPPGRLRRPRARCRRRRRARRRERPGQRRSMSSSSPSSSAAAAA